MKPPVTIEDLCKFALLRGVQINIGVPPSEEGKYPERITIQICGRGKGDKPYSFQQDLLKLNPRINAQLSVAIIETAQKAKPVEVKVRLLNSDGV